VKRPRSKNDDNEKWLNEVELTGESVPKDVVVGEGKPDHEGILVLAGCNQGRAWVIVNPRLTSNGARTCSAMRIAPSPRLLLPARHSIPTPAAERVAQSVFPSFS
jgi:hypothetical protein